MNQREGPSAGAARASVRLQKLLAQAGLGSRRRCEQLIAAGAVALNGKVVTTLGTTADPLRDAVTVNGVPVDIRPRADGRALYVLVNKPRHVLTTASDPRGRPTVMHLVEDVPQIRAGAGRRVYPVGRLDWDSEGLVLLTDSGSVAYRLTHPSFEVPRTYMVQVEGVPDAGDLERLREGVPLSDGVVGPADVEMLEEEPSARTAPAARAASATLLVTVREGRKHLVKRMCEAVGHRVAALRRVSMGPLSLGRLKPGEYRVLTDAEARLLEDYAFSLRQRRRPAGIDTEDT